MKEVKVAVVCVDYYATSCRSTVYLAQLQRVCVGTTNTSWNTTGSSPDSEASQDMMTPEQLEPSYLRIEHKLGLLS
jgi:hypothetical protein